ncbi:hypothetical protein OJ998_28960 [Solirubrobacter taibaiensis]|nr:hypothetical protein [Solirubrobacter taibaiensis]
MRALIGALVLAVLAAVPASARAQEPMCKLGAPDMNATIAFQAKLGPYITQVFTRAGASGGEAGVAVREVLGGQFVMLWLDNWRQGWSVAFSPGAQDATSARSAVRGALAARLDPAAVDYLDSTLQLVPTPYSDAELQSVMAQVFPLLTANGITAGGSISCGESDAVRVELDVIGPDTPELRAQVEALLAPFGDKVRATYGHSPALPAIAAPPLNTPRQEQRPTPKVREYVTLPRTSRCARTVAAKPRAGLGVERVRLQIGKRSVSARGGKAARLPLKSKRSQVTVTVFVKDSVPVTEKLTYRRCA